MRYPSGRWVSYDVTGANRVAAVRKGNPATNDYYQLGTAYAAHGAVETRQMSRAAGAGAAAMSETRSYNGRLQLKRVAAAPVGYSVGWACAGTYDAETLAETGEQNAGNVRYERVQFGTPVVRRTYGYDTAGRVTSFAETPVAKSQEFGYDGFGNVWQTGVSGVPALAATQASWYLQTDGTVNNRFNGIGYTEAGHQAPLSLFGGPWQGRYDAEGRQVKVERVDVNPAVTMAEYGYDAEGRRVKKTVGGVTTYYVWDARGLLMAEYGGVEETAGTHYYVRDQVGSTRLVMNQSGGCVSRVDYAPFGGEIERAGEPCYGAGAEVKHRFTGKERDPETGLDYSGARYYSWAQGRFTSPDLPLVDQHFTDPQTWNLYAYARNNPLKYVDPTGRVFCSYPGGNIPDGGAAADEKACEEGGGTWVFQPTDTDDPNADAETFQFSVTRTENTGELSASGQAVAGQLEANAAPSLALIGAVAGGSAATGAAVALGPTAGSAAIDRFAFGPAAGRVFWSGAGASTVATQWATSHSGSTLEMTRVGRALDALTQVAITSGVSWDRIRPMWAAASRTFATGAQGPVMFFQGRSISSSGIWMTVERQTLVNSGIRIVPGR